MTESTTRKPRKREHKDKPIAKWNIGEFEIEVDNGVYHIAHGPYILISTTDALYFKDYCALLEKSVK